MALLTDLIDLTDHWDDHGLALDAPDDHVGVIDGPVGPKLADA